MSLTPAEAGVLFVLTFGVLYWLGVLPTVQALLGFLGTVLIGTSGWIGRFLGDVTSLAVRLTDQLGADLFGAFTLIGVTLVLGFIFFHDLHPQHVTGRRTAWVGIALGCLVVAGLTGIPALAGLHQGIVSATTSVIGAL
jgi:hypothetical protein